MPDCKKCAWGVHWPRMTLAHVLMHSGQKNISLSLCLSLTLQDCDYDPFSVQGRPSSDIKIVQQDERRLPVPCPFPSTLTKATLEAIANEQLMGNMKIRLLREAATYYHGLCPRPNQTEYTSMAQMLCEKCPQLRDKMPRNNEYWVS